MSITAWSDELSRKLKTEGKLEGKLEGIEEGIERGIEKGVALERRNGLVRSAAKRLKRPLTDSEQSALLANATPEHWAAIDDAIFADDERELLAWLTPRS